MYHKSLMLTTIGAYQLPLMITALLHAGLINVGISGRVALAGHDDVALFT